MTQENVCPSCGAPLDNNTGNSCPSCGVALPVRPVGNSAPTMISSKSAFNSSAEVMDEVKRLIKQGDTDGATEVVSAEFGQTHEAAEGMVEQTLIDSHYVSNDAPVDQTARESTPGRVIDAPGYQEPKKPSNTRNWIIGGSIAAVVFLCLCCCMPLVIALVMWKQNH